MKKLLSTLFTLFVCTFLAYTPSSATETPAEVVSESAAEVATVAPEEELVLPDIIEMKGDYKHKKAIVKFPHERHAKELEISCGECHHDNENKPLVEPIKAGEVGTCITCHTQQGKPKSGVKELAEKLKYHAGALHINCITCHKAYNKEKGEKLAPSRCSKCHVKVKKKKRAAIEGC